MATERLVVDRRRRGGHVRRVAGAPAARAPTSWRSWPSSAGHFTSYSACGIPYWVGGDVAGAGRADRAHARGAPGARHRPADAHGGHGASTSRAAGCASRDLESGRRGPWTSYDKLVLATGARPVRPPTARHRRARRARRADPRRRQALLDTPGPRRQGRRAVVVGAGYIGVEMAEALIRRGYEVTVVNRGQEPMSHARPGHGPPGARGDGGPGHHHGRRRRGHQDPHRTTTAGSRAVATRRTPSTRRTWSCSASASAPRPTLAAPAGLPLGDHGGLLTDLSMRVRGHENIWAGGDCVEVLDLVSGRERHIALGTHANKHGQVIGANVGGGYATFPGVVGTAVSKVCDLEIARTGLREKDAHRAGLRFETVTIESTQPRGLLPGRRPHDGEDARRTPHRAPARRADRRPRGRRPSGSTSPRSRSPRA